MGNDAGDTEQQHAKTGPAGYMAGKAKWPVGALVAGAPPEAHLIRAMVEKITDLMAQRGLSRADLAVAAGLSRQTVYNLLDGANMPAVTTIVTLERLFGRRLWGNAHRKTP